MNICNSYQKWLLNKRNDGHDPERFWDDCKFHTWLRTGPFNFLCGAYGAKYETVIAGRYFLLFSYNTFVDGSYQHLITHVNGKFETVHKCQSTQDAQMYAHDYAKEHKDE